MIQIRNENAAEKRIAAYVKRKQMLRARGIACLRDARGQTRGGDENKSGRDPAERIGLVFFFFGEQKEKSGKEDIKLLFDGQRPGMHPNNFQRSVDVILQEEKPWNRPAADLLKSENVPGGQNERRQNQHRII